MKVDIAIPCTRLDFLTYHSESNLQIGDLVLVPLRNKLNPGIVINTNSTRDVPNIKKVKEIIEQKFIPQQLLSLYKWMADYYLATLGETLHLALPSKILKKYEVHTEVKNGSEIVKVPKPNPAQHNAIKRIKNALGNKRFKTFLLFGITGSGKTEIYLRVVEEVIKNKGRALILVPEISMTPLLLNRFKQRFNGAVVTIHSSLTDKERRQLWYSIKSGHYRVIIGPRSTIFIPIPDLQLIVVDEEHDHSYKEHTRMPRYNARDVAVMRAKFEKTVVILGSATPQIESYYNAGIGKYELLTLKERIDNKKLPEIEMVDLKKVNKKYISQQLEDELLNRLKMNEQAIIFLNRRGFAPSLVCPSCGYIARCPYCSLPMVYHRLTKNKASILSCHTCNYKTKKITICPQCKRHILLYRGAGTQRIEEMITTIAKNITPDRDKKKNPIILRLDRDSARKKGQFEKILKAFEQGKSQILLGTQLVTKGFDFPKVTLVGVINADIILNLPDFRSNEKTFQILTQVAGRSGRGEKQGKVIIQTFHPEQYALLFSQLQDYPRFFIKEIKLRKELNFPPFSKLILIRFKGTEQKVVWDEAEKLARILKRYKRIKVYGPNHSFYYRIRKYYRVFILIKMPKSFKHQKFYFLTNYRPPNCKMEIDVDPLEVF